MFPNKQDVASDPGRAFPGSYPAVTKTLTFVTKIAFFRLPPGEVRMYSGEIVRWTTYLLSADDARLGSHAGSGCRTPSYRISIALQHFWAKSTAYPDRIVELHWGS
jgi:hypothetical protein